MPVTEPLILQPELDFFERIRSELFARSAGKYALVKGAALLGVYDTELEAVRVGYQQTGNEPFLVKQIVARDVPVFLAANWCSLIERLP